MQANPTPNSELQQLVPFSDEPRPLRNGRMICLGTGLGCSLIWVSLLIAAIVVRTTKETNGNTSVSDALFIAVFATALCTCCAGCIATFGHRDGVDAGDRGLGAQ